MCCLFRAAMNRVEFELRARYELSDLNSAGFDTMCTVTI